jgi:hypothetical protein
VALQQLHGHAVVRCREHFPDLVDGQVDAAQIADEPGVPKLVHAVTAVRRPWVDRGRLENADVVVVPQRVHGEPAGR